MMRRARPTSWCLCGSLLLLATSEAAAESREPRGLGTLAAHAAAVAASMHASPPTLRGNGNWVRAVVREERERRPGGLVPLYVSFAALQSLDAHSTLAGVREGHTEANPFMAPVARQPALLIGAKTAAGVGTIVLAERLWRRHRTAAIVLMVAVNLAHAAVVAHNYRQLRR